MSDPIVLGIETSCDETGVGIVQGSVVLANSVASSMEEHARFGGVVPEVAARAHLESIPQVLQEALDTAGLKFRDLDGVAVTGGPGLAGSLMVGVGAAKAISASLKIPLYSVNHLIGHVCAGYVGRKERMSFQPTIALLVSGGHTSLLLVNQVSSDVELLGETFDDAAGEAFDKVARLLGLGYPGGPAIDKVSKSLPTDSYDFPRPLMSNTELPRNRYNFSFSGLKTAVARFFESEQANGRKIDVASVSSSFQEAVVDVLVTKSLLACRDKGIPRLLIVGGVAANSRLRAVAEKRCALEGVELRVPDFSLCTDNGAMIAALGSQRIMGGFPPSSELVGVFSSLSPETIQL